MKKPSPYQSILWDMDLKSTPALSLTRDRHVQAVAVLAAAAVDGLKSETIERQYPVVLPFLVEAVLTTTPSKRLRKAEVSFPINLAASAASGWAKPCPLDGCKDR
jgi:hypothetical protein